MKKINVVGTSGSGKSTVSKLLAAKLNYPYIEMDAVYWKADWQEPSDEEFIAKLAKESGYSEEVSNKILSLNMAGRLREIFIFAQQEKFYQILLKYCYEHCHKIAPEIELNLYLINNDQTHIKYNK